MRNTMFKKAKKAKKEALDIDITSLLDILVILLVFLLKSYNASDLTVDVVDNLTLPDSNSKMLGHHAIVVQIDKRGSVFVDNIQLEGVSLTSSKIESLYNKLLEKKKEDDKSRSVASASNEGRHINILLDQSHPYDLMQKIMHTSALAGYSKFKLIVQGRSNE